MLTVGKDAARVERMLEEDGLSCPGCGWRLARWGNAWDQMIELAAQRCDLASVPLREVSGLASAVAAEIGYSPGTARRELARHVRGVQAAPAESTPEGEGGEAQ